MLAFKSLIVFCIVWQVRGAAGHYTPWPQGANVSGHTQVLLCMEVCCCLTPAADCACSWVRDEERAGSPHAFLSRLTQTLTLTLTLYMS